MSKDKLIVTEDRYTYRIVWWLAEEGEEGATIGEDLEILEQPAPSNREAWEHWTAVRTAAATSPQRDGRGYYWDSRSAAQGVLRQIKAMLKAKRPLEEWERRALAAGWKPPKGWQT